MINHDRDIDVYNYLHALSYTHKQKLQILKDNIEEDEQNQINDTKVIKNSKTDDIIKKESSAFFKKVFSIMLESDVFDDLDEIIINKEVIEKDYSEFRKDCQYLLNRFFTKQYNKKYCFKPFCHDLYKFITQSTGGRFSFILSHEKKVEIPPPKDDNELIFSPKINPESYKILKSVYKYYILE